MSCGPWSHGTFRGAHLSGSRPAGRQSQATACVVTSVSGSEAWTKLRSSAVEGDLLIQPALPPTPPATDCPGSVSLPARGITHCVWDKGPPRFLNRV